MRSSGRGPETDPGVETVAEGSHSSTLASTLSKSLKRRTQEERWRENKEKQLVKNEVCPDFIGFQEETRGGGPLKPDFRLRQSRSTGGWDRVRFVLDTASSRFSPPRPPSRFVLHSLPVKDTLC